MLASKAVSCVCAPTTPQGLYARRFRPTTCLHAALCITHTYSACQTCARALRVRQRCGPARGAQEHKTPVACGTLGAVLIGCLAIVLPPVAFWGELEINTLANPAQPLPHIWPQARACAGTAALGQESAARARARAWSGGRMLRRRREPGRVGCMYLQGPHTPGEACSAAARAVLSAGGGRRAARGAPASSARAPTRRGCTRCSAARSCWRSASACARVRRSGWEACCAWPHHSGVLGVAAGTCIFTRA